MSDTKLRSGKKATDRSRIKKSERRRQILLELKLRPHVRISHLAQRFQVSTETVRRDLDALSDDGLINRAHGGASAPAQGHYPNLDERANARIQEREAIGLSAAGLVQDGETVMIDSGSTTIEMARVLAYLGTECTVITNSIPVAVTLGNGPAKIFLCPGEYLPAESAVAGTETIEFLRQYQVNRAIIGASCLSTEGPSETVAGFAAVKRTMLLRATHRHLLIDSEKFGRKGLARVSQLDDLESIVVDRSPKGDLLAALEKAGVDIVLAETAG